jgi:glutamate-1-semialdehyde 2,1-aminomutase
MEKSLQLFNRASHFIPGGVNSPVRAFKSVGGTPVFMESAKGAYLFDVDGNRYIDYINSWGPMILGHAHPSVTEAVSEQLLKSSSFGAPTELEVDIAELIVRMVPNIDMVRMVNSGTEACMSALRLARAYTGKNKIIKFEGCYHGHADSFLIKSGSGVATLQIQHVPGVTQTTADDTLTAGYNDLESVKKLFAEHPGKIAAVFIEPVAGNMGCVPPVKNFLQHLRDLCTKENALLVFDEVMTGFRLAPGGAQEIYNVKADLLTFGKIIGGGLPVGAYAGSKAIMEKIAPVGNVYQAGTLSGNPLAMAAGLAVLTTLHEDPSIYSSLATKTKQLSEGLAKTFREHRVPAAINTVGSMLSVHFTDKPVTDFASAQAANSERFKEYFHFLLREGIYLPPSAFESWFVCDALSPADIDYTIEKTGEFLKTRV